MGQYDIFTHVPQRAALASGQFRDPHLTSEVDERHGENEWVITKYNKT